MSDPILEAEARASASLDAPYVERFPYEALKDFVVDIPAVYDRNSWITRTLKTGDVVELPRDDNTAALLYLGRLRPVKRDEWEAGIERLSDGVLAALVSGMPEQRIREEVEVIMAETHEDPENREK